MTSLATASAVATLSPEALRALIDWHQDLAVIDVRSAVEFESMHIRWACSVPLPNLALPVSAAKKNGAGPA